MAQSFTTEGLKILFAYPFRMPDWKNKFLIGSVLMFAGYFIPIVPMLLVYGYGMQIMRRIIVEKGEPFLPEWDDWGKLLIDGLKVLGASFIYLLPIVLVFMVGYGLFFVTMFVPAFATGPVENGNGAASPLVPLVPVLGMAGFMGTFGLGLVLMLIIGLFIPVGVGHLVATGDFAAAFRFGELWAIFRANAAGFLASYALLLAFWFGLSFVMSILYFTIIFCCLAPLITPAFLMYTIVIWSALFAQAYREGVERLRGEAMVV